MSCSHEPVLSTHHCFLYLLFPPINILHLKALVSDYDCWKPTASGKDKKILLQEIIANMNIACNNCVNLIETVLSSKHALNGHDCICRKSLELAVWTDKKAIPEYQAEKLKVLFE